MWEGEKNSIAKQRKPEEDGGNNLRGKKFSIRKTSASRKIKKQDKSRLWLNESSREQHRKRLSRVRRTALLSFSGSVDKKNELKTEKKPSKSRSKKEPNELIAKKAFRVKFGGHC